MGVGEHTRNIPLHIWGCLFGVVVGVNERILVTVKNSLSEDKILPCIKDGFFWETGGLLGAFLKAPPLFKPVSHGLPTIPLLSDDPGVTFTLKKKITQSLQKKLRVCDRGKKTATRHPPAGVKQRSRKASPRPQSLSWCKAHREPGAGLELLQTGRRDGQRHHRAVVDPPHLLCNDGGGASRPMH